MSFKSGLSPIQADKPWYNLVYTTLISVDLAQYEIFVIKFSISGNGVKRLCYKYYNTFVTLYLVDLEMAHRKLPHLHCLSSIL